MSAIQFSRSPYTVTYFKDGQKQTYRRVPPPKMHDALPTDKVELTVKKSDDFEEGEVYSVRHINSRHPNTLQLENAAGQTTFVPYFDVNLTEKVAPRDGVDPLDNPVNNRYLLWP